MQQARLSIPAISLLLLPAFYLFVDTADADIYKYVNDEGIECYTDAPTSGKASVFMKDSRLSRKVSPSNRKPPLAKPATYVSSQSEKTVSAAAFPVSGRITSVVGLRNDPIDGILRTHQGFDIAAPSGTPIRAVAPGRALFSGTRPGYGKIVVIGHDDGMKTIYAHNSMNLVSEGDVVSESTVLALTGSTGHSTGPHLHFEAWREGINITASLLGNPSGPDASGRRRDDGIRRIIGSDGSLVFTNLR